MEELVSKKEIYRIFNTYPMDGCVICAYGKLWSAKGLLLSEIDNLPTTKLKEKEAKDGDNK